MRSGLGAASCGCGPISRRPARSCPGPPCPRMTTRGRCRPFAVACGHRLLSSRSLGGVFAAKHARLALAFCRHRIGVPRGAVGAVVEGRAIRERAVLKRPIGARFGKLVAVLQVRKPLHAISKARRRCRRVLMQYVQIHAGTVSGPFPATSSSWRANCRTVSIPGFCVSPLLTFQMVVNGTPDSLERCCTCA